MKQPSSSKGSSSCQGTSAFQTSSTCRARCYAEACFQTFITDNLKRLRDLAEPELLTEFRDLKLNLRQGFVSTGMGDLRGKLLTLEEAKKRKAKHVYQARKREQLLQSEQPKAIQCAA